MTPSELVMYLLSPEGRQDPYPHYARLREQGSVVQVEPGYLVATTYNAVDAVLRDPRLGVDPTEGVMGRSILNTNPPDHTRMRRLMSGAFTPRRVNGLQEAIATQADSLIDHMRDKGAPADLIADFAYRLPLTVICELLGVPETDRTWFRPVAADIAVALEATLSDQELAAAVSASDLLRAYFANLVRARRGTPHNDLVSDLAGADALAEDELLGNLALLLIAGFETTTSLIGNGMMTLLQRPDQLAQLGDRPDLAESYVEEFLRFDSPVQLTSRTAMEPSVIDGREIDPGGYVLALIGSANRDPARFHDPDAFVPDRQGNAPISFGAGAHFCLGAALARLEARIAIPALLRRLPDLGLAAPPVRRNRLVLRGYESLPVSWGR